MSMLGEPPEQPRAKRAPVPTPEERAAELARDEKLTTRDIRRSFLVAIGGCVFWSVAGLASIGWALHTTDAGRGHIAFLAGLLVGYTGIVVTLARYYLKGERAGWW